MTRSYSPISRIRRAAAHVFEPLEPRQLYSSTALLPPAQHHSIKSVALHKPGRPDLEPGSDNGTDHHDNLTSVVAPIFDVARVDSGVTLQLLRDGVVVASVLSGNGGTISIQDSGPVPAGTHTYAAREMAADGRLSGASQGLSVTFIFVAPPATPDLTDASDSGASNTDNVTSINNPVFTIGNVATGQTVTLLRDGVAVASAVASGPSVSLQDSGSLADGSYTYAAYVTDSNGFTSAGSNGLVVTVDRTAPAAPSAPDLSAASDNGSSDSDNVTSLHTLAFVINGVEDGATVSLLRDGAVVASGVAGGGSITLSDTVAGVGNYAYTTHQTDLAGNLGGDSATLNVSVVPDKPATPNAPDLQATSDSGSSDSDNLTNVTSPIFDITGVTAGLTVELLRDGNVVASGLAAGGTISLQDLTLSGDGTHQYTAMQISSTAQASDASSALQVTLDTAGPLAPSAPTLTLASDSGIKGDGVTRDRHPSFTVTGLEPGATVQLLVDGAAVSTVTALDGSVHPLLAVAPGAHTFSAQQIDAAGNVGQAGGAMGLRLVNGLASSDFDGDGVSDMGIFTDGTGLWQINLSSGGTYSEVFGDGGGWTPVPGDYDGDGKTDLAIYTSGVYMIEPSSQPGTQALKFFGTGSNPLPVAADYDGDGKTDIATYDADTGRFDILLSSTGASINLTLGTGGSNLPVVADYDGDGKADPAIYNPSTGVWTIDQSTTGTVMTRTFGGGSTIVPVPADYDGDGFDDLATYDTATGTFSVLASGGGTMTQTVGAPSAHPVAGDFDGDGKIDFASYATTSATLTIAELTGTSASIVLGNAGDPNEALPMAIDQVHRDVLGS